jgi:8-oxo-dGTP pyrophosphatase MutT (NUDIX family)
MRTGTVRAIAILVALHEGAIFVMEGEDTVRQEIFYRPLGGTIEFGEHSAETVRRELREELGAELSDLDFLGTCENVFVHNGQAGHEIVLVYRGEFADPRFYAQASFQAHEDSGMPFTARWVPLRDFFAGKHPLYPDGLLELLVREKLVSEN